MNRCRGCRSHDRILMRTFLLFLALVCTSCQVAGDVVVATVGAEATGVIVGKDITTVCKKRPAGVSYGGHR